ncbi:hypothetical protein ITP53_47805 [Nonomuraea sp. K274]|uniref:Uncharacterized protein n=1 Tax=Nonomuraea cypriaca TaxID=1187855 RepID=A0A931F428_9ACTN|nr:hypothetical protein [Nonomuraea cypriaca]MBF8193250.1 hypothetical protein [Nonomuraea cypriaca]
MDLPEAAGSAGSIGTIGRRRIQSRRDADAVVHVHLDPVHPSPLTEGR